MSRHIPDGADLSCFKFYKKGLDKRVNLYYCSIVLSD